MKKRIIIISLSSLIALAIIVLSVFLITSNKEIEIVGLMTLSGNKSLNSMTSVNAINMAIDELNKDGGIKGKKIKFEVDDGKNSVDQTVNIYKKIKGSANILICSLSDDCALAVARLAQKDQIPVIFINPVSDSITEVGDYIFQTCYSDSFQGTIDACFAYDSLHKKNAAIVYPKDSSSSSLAAEFNKTFSAKGGTIVADKSYSVTDQNFTALLSYIKDSKPDVLFIPDNSTRSVMITKYARALGLVDLTILGGNQWSDIASKSGNEISGSYYPSYFSDKSTDAKQKDFTAKYYNAFNQSADENAALGYESMEIIINALKTSGSTNKVKIKDAINKTNGSFLMGNFYFDSNRKPVKGAAILKLGLQNGKVMPVYYTTINPGSN